MEGSIDGITLYPFQNGLLGRQIADTPPQLSLDFKRDKRAAMCLEPFVLELPGPRYPIWYRLICRSVPSKWCYGPI